MEKKRTRKTEKEWKKQLSQEEYAILRAKGTEQPFSGKHLDMKEKGVFACKACGNKLFSSKAKFDSGTGWPSFDSALPEALEYRADSSHGMSRTEVVCARCDSHLGHIFEDGPTKTGKRYCINAICLKHEKTSE